MRELATLGTDTALSLQALLQRVVDLIPPAWHYPDETCARIAIGDLELKTAGFCRTQWKQSAPIELDSGESGVVEVYYLTEKPERDEGPFLNEERARVDSLARQTARIIAHRHVTSALQAANQQLAARDQQLRATEQQLRATEQQLRASNQHLEATNQQREEAAARERQLNAVLHGVRDVNRLITRERDPRELIQGACEILVRSRGVAKCSITLLDGQRVSAFADAGDASKLEPLRRMFDNDELPDCMRLAIDSGKPSVCHAPAKSCAACPVDQDYTSERDAVAVRLEHHGEVLGAMLVSFPAGSFVDSSEIELIQKVADDVALALRTTSLASGLRDSEARFRAAFDSASIGRALTLPDGRLDRVNSALCAMLGYSPAELEAKTFSAITHPDDLEASRECVRCLASGERGTYRFEKRYLHRDGALVWTDVNTTLLRDEHGEPLNFITDIVDITERKRGEEALREHERELDLTLDATTDGIWKWDFRTNELFFSSRYYAMLGYEADEFSASFEAWRDLLHPDDRDQAIAVAETYLATKPDTYENQFRLRTKTR